jgi:hypothetical protein
MATALDPKQIVSFEELLMSQVVQQEAITRLLVERRIFTKEEFLEMVRRVDKEMKYRGRFYECKTAKSFIHNERPDNLNVFVSSLCDSRGRIGQFSF